MATKQRKYGEDALRLNWEQGCNDLMNFLYADSNIVQASSGRNYLHSSVEPGPQIEPEPEKPSILESRINRIGPARDERSRDDREMDRD
jgi:hypothetical protein